MTINKKLFYHNVFLTLWFFICTASLLMMDLHQSIIFIFVIIYLSAAVLISEHYGLKAILYLFLIILPLQPFLTMPFSTALTSQSIKIFVSLKELILLIIAFIAFKKINTIKFTIIDYTAILFLSVYSYGLLSSGFGFQQLVSYREGAVLVALYFVGRLLYFFDIKTKEVILICYFISVPLIIFGFIERFVIGSWFWEKWGAVNYLTTKFSSNLTIIHVYDGIPSNWYTLINGTLFKRIVSTVGDAPSFSRYLSFSVVSFLFFNFLRKKDINFFIFAASVLCLILTLSRGGIIICLGGLIVFLLHSNFRYKYFTLFPIAAVFLFIIAQQSIFDINSAVAVRHTTGLLDGIKNSITNIGGNGLGTSGQLALLYAENIDEKIGESYIGGLSYQLGIIGIFTFSLWFITSIVFLYKKYSVISKFDKDKSNQILFIISMIAGVYLTAFFSNSAVAPISCGLAILSLGLTVTEITHVKYESLKNDTLP